MACTAMLDPKTEPILDAATRFLWSEDMNESREAFIANHVSLFAGADGPEGEQRLAEALQRRQQQGIPGVKRP